MFSTGRFTKELRALRARSYDRCQSCGAQLPREIAAYAGYASDGAPLYVGECCKPKVHELASHIYWWWKADTRCDPSTTLWRYMDFAKFVSLLESKSLFFARADKLGDPFEGASGIAQRQAEWDAYHLAFFRDGIRTAPGQRKAMDAEELESEAARLLKEYRDVVEMERKSSFVSCWHANDGESEAIWRLYCPPPVPGVAIKTNAGLLYELANMSADVEVGKVQYINFQQSFAAFYGRIFWKRKSLSHEAEVRAVITERSNPSVDGIAVPIDLERLCLAVVPSPFAPPWFPELVSSILKRYGLALPLMESELLAEPFF